MTIRKTPRLHSALPCTGGDHHHPGRRDVLLRALSLAGVGLLPAIGRAQEALKPTWMEIIGPFYPVEKPADQDADLTLIAGKTERAKGDILYLSGSVLARNGTPVAGAVLEIWQANAAGRYAHTGDKIQHHWTPTSRVTHGSLAQLGGPLRHQDDQTRSLPGSIRMDACASHPFRCHRERNASGYRDVLRRRRVERARSYLEDLIQSQIPDDTTRKD